MKFLKYILWLLFPNRCVSCNALLKRNEDLCSECSKKLERIKKICKVCGCEKSVCQCKMRVFHFSGAAAPFSHGECSKQIINNFKFRNNIQNADFLSHEMCATVNNCFADIDFDYITCVPMLKSKKFINGFNQSEVLAKKLSKQLGIPYINCLKKVRRTSTQHRTPYKERFSNVKGAYSCDKISASNVLLVDDIKTTGATLDECARQLLFAGAEKVYTITAISNNYKKQQLKKS